uniref:Uncharacterized protein n=1 Tax=Arundo donax TaxID=35708 RepID=A0A0A8ZW80_ARUDO
MVELACISLHVSDIELMCRIPCCYRIQIISA